MYVVVIIETDSDTPGVERVFGPFMTYEQAQQIQTVTNAVIADTASADGRVAQVAQVESV